MGLCNLAGSEGNVRVFTNLSYTEERNFVERKIRNLKNSLKQIYLLKKGMVLSHEANLNLILAVTEKWNNFSYSRR